MKILTANVAFGIPRMDHLLRNLRAHMAIHGPLILSYFFLPFVRGTNLPSSAAVRERFIQKHSNLSPIFRLIESAAPDAIILNELVYEFHQTLVEEKLGRIGFVSFAWGRGTHHKGSIFSTLVASKKSATIFDPAMPHLPYPGSGAGAAGLRLDNEQISIIGAHLSNGVFPLWHEQVRALAVAAAHEQTEGRAVILAGDFNASWKMISTQSELTALGLTDADREHTFTCPTCVPAHFRSDLDHIFIPTSWSSKKTELLSFGSDHLALVAQVKN